MSTEAHQCLINMLFCLPRALTDGYRVRLQHEPRLVCLIRPRKLPSKVPSLML